MNPAERSALSFTFKEPAAVPIVNRSQKPASAPEPEQIQQISQVARNACLSFPNSQGQHNAGINGALQRSRTPILGYCCLVVGCRFGATSEEAIFGHLIKFGENDPTHREFYRSNEKGIIDPQSEERSLLKKLFTANVVQTVEGTWVRFREMQQNGLERRVLHYAPSFQSTPPGKPKGSHQQQKAGLQPHKWDPYSVVEQGDKRRRRGTSNYEVKKWSSHEGRKARKPEEVFLCPVIGCNLQFKTSSELFKQHLSDALPPDTGHREYALKNNTCRPPVPSARVNNEKTQSGWTDYTKSSFQNTLMPPPLPQTSSGKAMYRPLFPNESTIAPPSLLGQDRPPEYNMQEAKGNSPDNKAPLSHDDRTKMPPPLPLPPGVKLDCAPSGADTLAEELYLALPGNGNPDGMELFPPEEHQDPFGHTLDSWNTEFELPFEVVESCVSSETFHGAAKRASDGSEADLKRQRTKE